MKKILLAATALTIMFASCKKEDSAAPTPVPPPVNPAAKLLKKITQTEAGITTIYNLTYDASKRLTSVKSTDNVETIDFTYNATGDVIKVVQVDSDFRNIYNYSYANGVPVGGTFKSWEVTAGEPDALHEDDVLTYTVLNSRVTKIKLEMLQMGETVNFNLSYNNGNVSKIESDGGLITYSANFSYGTKKQPAPKVFNYAMDQAGFFLQFFAGNEITQIRFDLPGSQGDVTLNTQYTYDATGYPLTSTTDGTVLKYEYE
ncbi:MAG: hypothetical protein V4676_00040 [Bacteroidota bacterium]